MCEFEPFCFTFRTLHATTLAEDNGVSFMNVTIIMSLGSWLQRFHRVLGIERRDDYHHILCSWQRENHIYCLSRMINDHTFDTCELLDLA